MWYRGSNSTRYFVEEENVIYTAVPGKTIGLRSAQKQYINSKRSELYRFLKQVLANKGIIGSLVGHDNECTPAKAKRQNVALNSQVNVRLL